MQTSDNSPSVQVAWYMLNLVHLHQVVLSVQSFSPCRILCRKNYNKLPQRVFGMDFKLATVTMVATGGLSIVLHLINRAAGR